MVRVTVAEVREILPAATKLTDPQISSAITAANLYVTEELEGEPCMTDERLKEVEKWMSAHIATTIDGNGGSTRRIKSENLEKEYATSSNMGDGLKSTRFGQMAIMFDCTGTLANAGKTYPSIESIGSI